MLAVSFLSLGLRTGTVVALSIPLVLAITFFAMKAFGIDLQRISLGALVIALGLLVDDAIIAVEMMVVKMEQGWDRFKAATFAYTSTAFPMLTGTLITAAAFTPVGFAKSAASEYTISIFQVVTIALLVSWIVAVVFTPYLGYKLLDPKALIAKAQKHGDDIYDTPFYRRFRARGDLVPAQPLEGDRRHRADLRAVHGGLRQVRAEAVLPARQPAGTDGRCLAAAGRVAQGHRRRGEAHRAVAQGRSGGRLFFVLHRQRRAALLPVAGPAIVRRQLRRSSSSSPRSLKEREDLKRRLEARFAAPDFADICGCAWCGWRTARRSAIRCSSA